VLVTLLPSTVCGEEPCQFLTSYLIGQALAIDAGSLGYHGSLEVQTRVRHVLISHSHIDHLASPPVFLENVYRSGPDCVTVHAGEAVLDSLQCDLFNDRVWPDFINLSPTAPFLRLSKLEEGRLVELEGLRITPVAVNHVVPTFGFLVEDDRSAVVIPTDTGPTDAIWQYANRSPNLKADFLEATFPRLDGLVC
jgi:ribonuclease BN (tRNA processing enzyme)